MGLDPGRQNVGKTRVLRDKFATDPYRLLLLPLGETGQRQVELRAGSSLSSLEGVGKCFHRSLVVAQLIQTPSNLTQPLSIGRPARPRPLEHRQRCAELAESGIARAEDHLSPAARSISRSPSRQSKGLNGPTRFTVQGREPLLCTGQQRGVRRSPACPAPVGLNCLLGAGSDATFERTAAILVSVEKSVHQRQITLCLCVFPCVLKDLFKCAAGFGELPSYRKHEPQSAVGFCEVWLEVDGLTQRALRLRVLPQLNVGEAQTEVGFRIERIERNGFREHCQRLGVASGDRVGDACLNLRPRLFGSLVGGLPGGLLRHGRPGPFFPNRLPFRIGPCLGQSPFPVLLEGSDLVLLLIDQLLPPCRLPRNSVIGEERNADDDSCDRGHHSQRPAVLHHLLAQVVHRRRGPGGNGGSGQVVADIHSQIPGRHVSAVRLSCQGLQQYGLEILVNTPEEVSGTPDLLRGDPLEDLPPIPAQVVGGLPRQESVHDGSETVDVRPRVNPVHFAHGLLG